MIVAAVYARNRIDEHAVTARLVCSTELAEACTALAGGWGRRARVAVTDMSQPLGEAVGNALDVAEAVELLSGRGAGRLRELEGKYDSILFVCSLMDWPWVRDAYNRQLTGPDVDPFFAPIQTFGVEAKTLIFVLGELPFLTGLYERGRRELSAGQPQHARRARPLQFRSAPPLLAQLFLRSAVG